MNMMTVIQFDTKAGWHGDTIDMMMTDTTARRYDDGNKTVMMTDQ